MLRTWPGLRDIVSRLLQWGAELPPSALALLLSHQSSHAGQLDADDLDGAFEEDIMLRAPEEMPEQVMTPELQFELFATILRNPALHPWKRTGVKVGITRFDKPLSVKGMFGQESSGVLLQRLAGLLPEKMQQVIDFFNDSFPDALGFVLNPIGKAAFAIYPSEDVHKSLAVLTVLDGDSRHEVNRQYTIEEVIAVVELLLKTQQRTESTAEWHDALTTMCIDARAAVAEYCQRARGQAIHAFRAEETIVDGHELRAVYQASLPRTVYTETKDTTEPKMTFDALDAALTGIERAVGDMADLSHSQYQHYAALHVERVIPEQLQHHEFIQQSHAVMMSTLKAESIAAFVTLTEQIEELSLQGGNVDRAEWDEFIKIAFPPDQYLKQKVPYIAERTTETFSQFVKGRLSAISKECYDHLMGKFKLCEQQVQTYVQIRMQIEYCQYCLLELGDADDGKKASLQERIDSLLELIARNESTIGHIAGEIEGSRDFMGRHHIRDLAPHQWKKPSLVEEKHQAPPPGDDEDISVAQLAHLQAQEGVVRQFEIFCGRLSAQMPTQAQWESATSTAIGARLLMLRTEAEDCVMRLEGIASLQLALSTWESNQPTMGESVRTGLGLLQSRLAEAKEVIAKHNAALTSSLSQLGDLHDAILREEQAEAEALEQAALMQVQLSDLGPDQEAVRRIEAYVQVGREQIEGLIISEHNWKAMSAEQRLSHLANVAACTESFLTVTDSFAGTRSFVIDECDRVTLRLTRWAQAQGKDLHPVAGERLAACQDSLSGSKSALTTQLGEIAALLEHLTSLHEAVTEAERQQRHEQEEAEALRRKEKKAEEQAARQLQALVPFGNDVKNIEAYVLKGQAQIEDFKVSDEAWLEMRAEERYEFLEQLAACKDAVISLDNGFAGARANVQGIIAQTGGKLGEWEKRLAGKVHPRTIAQLALFRSALTTSDKALVAQLEQIARLYEHLQSLHDVALSEEQTKALQVYEGVVSGLVGFAESCELNEVKEVEFSQRESLVRVAAIAAVQVALEACAKRLQDITDTLAALDTWESAQNVVGVSASATTLLAELRESLTSSQALITQHQAGLSEQHRQLLEWHDAATRVEREQLREEEAEAQAARQLSELVPYGESVDNIDAYVLAGQAQIEDFKVSDEAWLEMRAEERYEFLEQLAACKDAVISLDNGFAGARADVRHLIVEIGEQLDEWEQRQAGKVHPRAIAQLAIFRRALTTLDKALVAQLEEIARLYEHLQSLHDAALSEEQTKALQVYEGVVSGIGGFADSCKLNEVKEAEFSQRESLERVAAIDAVQAAVEACDQPLGIITQTLAALDTWESTQGTVGVSEPATWLLAHLRQRLTQSQTAITRHQDALVAQHEQLTQWHDEASQAAEAARRQAEIALQKAQEAKAMLAEILRSDDPGSIQYKTRLQAITLELPDSPLARRVFMRGYNEDNPLAGLDIQGYEAFDGDVDMPAIELQDDLIFDAQGAVVYRQEEIIYKQATEQLAIFQAYEQKAADGTQKYLQTNGHQVETFLAHKHDDRQKLLVEDPTQATFTVAWLNRLCRGSVQDEIAGEKGRLQGSYVYIADDIAQILASLTSCSERLGKQDAEVIERYNALDQAHRSAQADVHAAKKAIEDFKAEVEGAENYEDVSGLLDTAEARIDEMLSAVARHRGLRMDINTVFAFDFDTSHADVWQATVKEALLQPLRERLQALQEHLCAEAKAAGTECKAMFTRIESKRSLPAIISEARAHQNLVQAQLERVQCPAGFTRPAEIFCAEYGVVVEGVLPQFNALIAGKLGYSLGQSLIDIGDASSAEIDKLQGTVDTTIADCCAQLAKTEDARVAFVDKLPQTLKAALSDEDKANNPALEAALKREAAKLLAARKVALCEIARQSACHVKAVMQGARSAKLAEALDQVEERYEQDLQAAVDEMKACDCEWTRSAFTVEYNEDNPFGDYEQFAVLTESAEDFPIWQASIVKQACEYADIRRAQLAQYGANKIVTLFTEILEAQTPERLAQVLGVSLTGGTQPSIQERLATLIQLISDRDDLSETDKSARVRFGQTIDSALRAQGLTEENIVFLNIEMGVSDTVSRPKLLAALQNMAEELITYRRAKNQADALSPELRAALDDDDQEDSHPLVPAVESTPPGSGTESEEERSRREREAQAAQDALAREVQLAEAARAATEEQQRRQERQESTSCAVRFFARRIDQISLAEQKALQVQQSGGQDVVLVDASESREFTTEKLFNTEGELSITIEFAALPTDAVPPGVMEKVQQGGVFVTSGTGYNFTLSHNAETKHFRATISSDTLKQRVAGESDRQYVARITFSGMSLIDHVIQGGNNSVRLFGNAVLVMAMEEYVGWLNTQYRLLEGGTQDKIAIKLQPTPKTMPRGMTSDKCRALTKGIVMQQLKQWYAQQQTSEPYSDKAVFQLLRHHRDSPLQLFEQAARTGHQSQRSR